MTGEGLPQRTASRVPDGVRSFWAGISAVSAKELRGRMRGRRAFVVVTIYLLLLSLFALGVYQLLQENAAQQARFSGGGFPGGFPEDGFSGSFVSGPVSAEIGHALFSGIVVVQTLLILVLAPAFTSGAISMEREKQTLELLITTPLSTLGMVVGKLFSALAYLFLLVVASIPLMSIVFAFGGVGPEDLVRAYLLLFAVAFGVGAVGLFMSALIGRTQVATVLSYVIVLGLTIGTAIFHTYLVATSPRVDEGGFVAIEERHQAPEALLWLNPLVADMDLICITAPSGNHFTCSYISLITGRPYFGDSFGPQGGPAGMECRPNGECFPVDDGFIVEDPGELDAGVGAVVAEEELELGFARDTFWPRTASTFLALGVTLTLLSTQLIAPSRRLRRRHHPERGPADDAIESPAEVQP
ncbi:MAG: ABC transporter permease [Chloroflexota bacterium]|nr:ABC transporter permease [Chloroflexota bacterium]